LIFKISAFDFQDRYHLQGQYKKWIPQDAQVYQGYAGKAHGSVRKYIGASEGLLSLMLHPFCRMERCIGTAEK
jgi:hypothetical protein